MGLVCVGIIMFSSDFQGVTAILLLVALKYQEGCTIFSWLSLHSFLSIYRFD